MFFLRPDALSLNGSVMITNKQTNKHCLKGAAPSPYVQLSPFKICYHHGQGIMEWYLWPIAEGGLETNDPF
jgi:hypothetical protein